MNNLETSTSLLTALLIATLLTSAATTAAAADTDMDNSVSNKEEAHNLLKTYEEINDNHASIVSAEVLNSIRGKVKQGDASWETGDYPAANKAYKTASEQAKSGLRSDLRKAAKIHLATADEKASGGKQVEINELKKQLKETNKLSRLKEIHTEARNLETEIERSQLILKTAKFGALGIAIGLVLAGFILLNHRLRRNNSRGDEEEEETLRRT